MLSMLACRTPPSRIPRVLSVAPLKHCCHGSNPSVESGIPRVLSVAPLKHDFLCGQL